MSAMAGYTRNLTEALCGHPGHWQRGKHEGGRGSPSLFRPWWCYTLWMTPGHLHQVVDQAPPGCPPDRDGWYESHAGPELERRISRQVIHGRPGCEDVRDERVRVQAGRVGLELVQQTNSLGGAPNLVVDRERAARLVRVGRGTTQAAVPLTDGK